MRLTQGILAVAATILTAASAHADWSAIATSCTPDESSVISQRYVTSGQIVAHRSNNVDLIKLVCAVSGSFPGDNDAWHLAVTYRDQTGTNNAAHVEARLLQASRADGSQTIVASFTSDGIAATTLGTRFKPFTHVFDFRDNYYFVILLLDRALTSQAVQVEGVAIEGALMP
jgi:hypothetical protein